jgi:hypothetical protein
MMLKYLRIAVTALSLTACVLLIALWVRSYWNTDPAEVMGIPVWLMDGTLRVYDPFPPPENLGKDEIYFGDASIGFPIWMLVIGAIAVAATPWIRWRFSYVGACQVMMGFYMFAFRWVSRIARFAQSYITRSEARNSTGHSCW